VKPPRFDYHEPTSLEEALDLLQRYGEDAKILAGGQSLMPLLNFRLSRPAALVDINRIGALAYIREHDDQLRIGAMTRQRAIEFSPLVRERLPLLGEATTLVGHLAIRTRGTLGGSLVHADPSAEYPAVVTALDAELVVRRPGGERRLDAGGGGEHVVVDGHHQGRVRGLVAVVGDDDGHRLPDVPHQLRREDVLHVRTGARRAAERGGHFDVHFVGDNLDQWLEPLDLVTRLLEPLPNRALVRTLS